MTYTAEHKGENFWIVVATDEEGNVGWTKKVFLNASKNTEADAIEVATSESTPE